MGVKLGTVNNVPTQLLTFPLSRLKNSGKFARTLDGDTDTGLILDGTSSLADGFLEEKFEKTWKFNIAENVAPDTKSRGNAVKGVEGWLELTQDQEVRDATGSAPTGLNSALGNFEPFRITRVLIGLQEENH